VRLLRKLLPLAGIAILLLGWDLAVRSSSSMILPGPGKVFLALVELARKGLLVRHVVASLFRVTWGFLGAVVFAIPLGIILGWNRRLGLSVSPFLEILRPISPLAWIPIAILWFGVGDPSAIFIIFLGSLLPMTVASMNAIRSVPQIHVNAGKNFGLSDLELLRRVVLPSILPQLFVALRLTLGVAWLVVVAAEMIAVRSGLGFLIVDSRNAGDRYDLVIAGMVLIGLIGIALDAGIRKVEVR